MSMSKKRIENHIQDLRAFTATPGNGVTRLTYSKEDLQAREYIKEQMEEYGLFVREDGIGNIFGKLEGTLKDGPSVIVGSHFDSVPNGGAYDGTAGVVVGLEVAALFKENNITPKYPLEIIAMIEEESSRFSGLMGSRGIVGSIDEADFKNQKDRDGISVTEAMSNAGLDASKPVYRDPSTMKAFLEMHIEQGPLLEESNVPIGVVQSIVGLTQLEVTIKGIAGHAGTTPMDRRSDALITATTIISKLPQFAIDEGDGTVTTVGRVQVSPNGANVIPDNVYFTVDIRSGKAEKVLNVVNKVKELVASYNGNGIQTSVEQSLYIEPKALNPAIRSLLAEVSDDLDVPHSTMKSGAGHDAMVLSDVTDVGLILVPSKDGISHSPDEFTSTEDLARGATVLYEAAKKLTEE
ncbi:allantoate deiminase [Virgibacillus natechei]|uniref:Allantoate deiminase n=1 Tax=Virgibacillus natechei TaxID=1216297 RepID=A0ABS4IKD9_9BACI|nr:Zn-dependent hydrolase [Virgibacillus natechei]MBP1971370.1 allantoate deiminase [Virgibacillus natechei]UZD12255.1 Zn-dependent hydrolase [Virgibacillus natechei]